MTTHFTPTDEDVVAYAVTLADVLDDPCSKPWKWERCSPHDSEHDESTREVLCVHAMKRARLLLATIGPIIERERRAAASKAFEDFATETYRSGRDLVPLTLIEDRWDDLKRSVDA